MSTVMSLLASASLAEPVSNAESVSGNGWIFLACVAMAAISVVWTAVRAGIAPMPSSGRACDAMIEAAADSREGTIFDLGSGWGTLAIRFARAFPRRRVVGFELSYVPWLVATLAARCLRLDNLAFVRRDFRDADLNGASVLLCYLFRDGMAQLARQLRQARRSPCGSTLVISNTFAMPHHEPLRIVRLTDFHRTRIYLYRLAACAD